MFLVSYRFFPKDGDAEAYFDGPLSIFLASLSQNGQIIGEWNIAAKGDCVEFIGHIPEETALSSDHYSEYAGPEFTKLLERSAREPEHTVLGPAVGTYSHPCVCIPPGSYVLHTNMLWTAPPVQCGDCGGHVPLYRLPPPEREGNHYGVLAWERTYKACDRLYVGSGVGERLGIGQMRNPRSKLAIEGLDICRDYAARTGKRFYYYLTWGAFRPFGNHCPGCGAIWETDRRIACRMDLVCDACGLVSMGEFA